MKSYVVSLGLLMAVSGAFAQPDTPMASSDNPSVLGTLMSSRPRYTREMVLGNILKGALENMHLSNKEINDSLSAEAFKMYLERIDYMKQFLLESDVKALEKYRKQFDDMMIS